MRLSSNVIFQNATLKMISLQSDQANLQNQISTGKRINVPSDDPIASSRVSTLKTAQSIDKQYASNRLTAETQLNAQEAVLSSATDLMLNVKTALVTAGNGAFNDTDRKSLSAELSNALQELVGLANSKDSVGNFAFSGFQSNTPAYDLVAGAYVYQGDANRVAVQVSTSRQIEVSNTGANVFQAGGNDLFLEIQNAITLLNTPVTSPALSAALTAGLATANNAMKVGLDNILSARADAGSRLKEIDSLNQIGVSSDIVYTQNISQIEDLDYAKAISDLTKQSFVLEAAQKSFVKVTSLSLFDLI